MQDANDNCKMSCNCQKVADVALQHLPLQNYNAPAALWALAYSGVAAGFRRGPTSILAHNSIIEIRCGGKEHGRNQESNEEDEVRRIKGELSSTIGSCEARI